MKESENDILKKLVAHIEEYGFHPEIIGEVMDVCGSSTIMIEDGNILNISFEVDAPATWAAVLTQELISFASKIGFMVKVYECYALVFDEEENCVDVLYGDDAVHYYETGEIHVEEDKNGARKKKPTIDDLKSELKSTIEKQEFEAAAKLRDKIHKMENGKSKTKCDD